MTTRRPLLARRAAPLALTVVSGAVALTVLLAHLAFAIEASSYTFGFDYLAYDAAARRLLSGSSPYDLSFSSPGAFGLFYYPPPFLLLVIPLTLFEAHLATWLWIGLLTAACTIGVYLMPVSAAVRALVLLLAGISWPFVYAVKLGQVGPLLFLAFVLGWRWLGRPNLLGATIAFGVLAKVQPAVLLGWLALEGRWRALTMSMMFATIVAVAATIVGGLSMWTDFATIIRRVQDPVTMPHNYTPGATAYYLGVPVPIAAGIQVISSISVVAVMVVASIKRPGERAYLVAVVGSQLLSPILWDHYALVLLLPVAWLLERGRYWAIAVPISQAYILVAVTPPIAYVVAFYAMLLAPVLTPVRGDDESARDGSFRRRNDDTLMSPTP